MLATVLLSSWDIMDEYYCPYPEGAPVTSYCTAATRSESASSANFNSGSVLHPTAGVSERRAESWSFPRQLVLDREKVCALAW